MSNQALQRIYAEVVVVERHVAEFLAAHRSALEEVHPEYRASAANLLAYVALRQLDLRQLQLRLGEWGLSSLGRCEGHVGSSLRELRARLEASLGLASAGADQPALTTVTRADGEALLHAHTRALLGPRPAQRHVSIMVTADSDVPSEDACAALIDAGMDVLRINSAHGSPAVWRRTAEVLRRVAARLERRIAVLVDLQGPKLRTARMADGPAVVRYRPEKDPLGQVVRALQVLLVGARSSPLPVPAGGPPPLQVPDAWLAELRVGDLVETVDARERRSGFRVIEVAPGAVVATIDRSCYLTAAAVLVWRRGDRELGRAPMGPVAPRPGHVELSVGDRFELALTPVEGRAGVRVPTGGKSWLVAPRIGLHLTEVELDLEPEHRVLLDDGKVEAVIEELDGTSARARVVKTAGDAVKIRAEKGVNFPDSEIRAPALTDRDREVLPAVLELADVIGISFVRGPTDLGGAIAEIRAAAGDRVAPGIVVKIETARAVERLPELLLEAMRHAPLGVMIARGDLAVEVGFERLAELQQEILWFAEAAHLPVVWATQVLDSLVRTGIPSRAEITDASMSVQAECVMLNKGPYVVDACRTLDTIIRQMEQHQYKKRNLYRPLSISQGMAAPEPLPPTPAADGSAAS